jgi:hypothetical protein
MQTFVHRSVEPVHGNAKCETPLLLEQSLVR